MLLRPGGKKHKIARLNGEGESLAFEQASPLPSTVRLIIQPPHAVLARSDMKVPALRPFSIGVMPGDEAHIKLEVREKAQQLQRSYSCFGILVRQLAEDALNLGILGWIEIRMIVPMSSSVMLHCEALGSSISYLIPTQNGRGRPVGLA